MTNSLGYTVFTPRVSKFCKIQPFRRKKLFFGLLYRLLVRKRCIFRSWSWDTKLLQITLLTSSNPTGTLYGVIENNWIRFKSHKICEFGQLWRFPEREQCKIKSLSWIYKLFKIQMLTNFILIETLYYQIWNICVRFVKSLNYSNLENFGDSWGENDASWKVDHGDQCCLKWYFWQLLFRSWSCTMK